MKNNNHKKKKRRKNSQKRVSSLFLFRICFSSTVIKKIMNKSLYDSDYGTPMSEFCEP